MSVSNVQTARMRNPRGEGGQLRADIIRAARRVLEASGREEAVTLRGIAREVGVTAPALYGHFADRSEIIEAVIGEAFGEFATAVTDAMSGITDPSERLRAGCRAYVHFAYAQPATYRILFTRQQPSAVPAVAAHAQGLFQLLVEVIADCVAAGFSGSRDPAADAVVLWLSLHGLAALPPSHPRFPWPDEAVLLDQVLSRSALLDVG
jgi:AcrR family transcriptional regulator